MVVANDDQLATYMSSKQSLYAAHRDDESEAASRAVRLYREAVNNWLFAAKLGVQMVEQSNAGKVAHDMVQEHSASLERTSPARRQ